MWFIGRGCDWGGRADGVCAVLAMVVVSVVVAGKMAGKMAIEGVVLVVAVAAIGKR